MPGFHVSFNFSQNTGRAGGWWEDYWNAATDLNTVVGEAALLQPLLEAIHGENTPMNAYRVSMVPLSGDSYTPTAPFVPLSQLINLVTTGPALISSSDFSDYPTTALELQVASQGTPQRITRQWVRGTYDAVTAQGGFYTPGGTASYSSAIGPFLSELCSTSRHWSVHVRDLAKVKQVIQTFDLTTGTYTMGNAHGFTVGQKVQVYKVAIVGTDGFGRKKLVNLRTANGLKTVAAVTSTTWNAAEVWTPPPAPLPQIDCSRARAGVVAYVMPQLEALTPSANRFAGAQIVRVTKRNVGRPSLVLIGRRKTLR